MSDHALIAVRPPPEAKARLAPALSPDRREALAWATARHVFACITAVIAPARCTVVSRSAAVRGWAQDAGAMALAEAGHGQNAALEQAARHARGVGAHRVLSLSSDLPLLTPHDVRAMLEAAGEGRVAIAIDRHGFGTNGLCLSPLAIAYRHGPGSFADHVAAARAAGLAWRRVHRPGLAHDVDEPADLTAAAPFLRD